MQSPKKNQLIKRTYRIYKHQDKIVKKVAGKKSSESNIIRNLIDSLIAKKQVK